MICEKYDQILKKLGIYFYLSLHTLRKDLVFYKYSSRISVLLGSHCCCCMELWCLRLVLVLVFANLNLCSIIYVSTKYLVWIWNFQNSGSKLVICTTSWGPGNHSMSPPECRPPFLKPKLHKESKNGFKQINFRSPL